MNRDFKFLKSGKVRDIYESKVTNELLIVASDRVSAFDVVLPTPIPGKGALLTSLSNYWFKKTAHIIKNHIVEENPKDLTVETGYSDLSERSVIVKKAKMVQIEAIVRGYITGSGLKEYQKTGKVCGITLEKGLVESQKLSEPIFTPSTKAPIGEHDENISFEQAKDIVGTELAEKVKDVSLKLYKFAADYAAKVGIIIADTKFEFGTIDGELILIDELFTPDSSRFWPLDEYVPGKVQPSFDKQFVRDYLNTLDWDKKAPGPELPAKVLEETSKKYNEAVRRLCQ